MIFSELYSAYYNAVAKIITQAVKGELDEKSLSETVKQAAFSESSLSVVPALKGEKWQLLRNDLSTPIKHIPALPLTVLQKRWLKSMLLDKRIALFGLQIKGLEDTLPLFTEQDICVYDKYQDGDDYESPEYIANFRLILSALREKRRIAVTMITRRNLKTRVTVMPQRLEYSEKDDKFRLICHSFRDHSVINLGRITECAICENDAIGFSMPKAKEPRSVTLELTDERNALERVMLHFAHFEKQAERIGESRYKLTLVYDPDDETELVIRILSFGPMVRVTSPARFVGLIKERLVRQSKFNLD
ncbi:MAG: WYL domain-containing protein [Clostridia bacterium]|nr:WYL domain-containing protein [Clostridia bacterium]MBO5915161.1 WYL domain-containing protein [Clostridia bacterium]